MGTLSTLSRFSLLTLVLILFIAAAALAARDGGVVIGDRGAKGGWKPPANIRELRENYEMLRQRPTEDIRQVKVEPILDALGSQLVGIVEKRTLTKPQMDLRVNLALQLQNLPASSDPSEVRDRRYGLETRVVEAWAGATALAVLAERLGYKATPAEIDQALRDLAAQSDLDPAHASQQATLLGIPEGELRRELEDGIIVEKMLREQVQTFKDEDLKRIYDRVRGSNNPDVFLDPTRVKAWHLVAVMVNSPTDDQLDTLESQMAKFAKKLKKCAKPADYEALKKEIGAEKGIMLTFLDSVAADESLKPPVIKSLFGLKPGATSGVIAAPEKPAKPTELHVVKIVERTEGHRGTFEEAKPQVQNFMIEKLRDYVYASLQQQYDIRTDPAGLNNYIEIGRIPAPGRPGASPTPAAAAPAPSATLRNPYAPELPGARGGALSEPPPVETIVGVKAERPAPGARKPSLTPDAQKALEEMTSRGQLSAGATAMLTQDMATTAAVPLAPIPAVPVLAPAVQTPLPRPVTRRGRPVPQHNYDAAPPAVDEVLSRRARETQK